MPTIKYDLSVTKLIEIGAILVAISLAWGKLDGRLTTIEESMQQVRHAQQEYVRSDVQLERDARTSYSLQEIDRRLARIENSLK